MTQASIILLSKNAAHYLPETLPAIFGQETDLKFEVIAIDSGSSDGTLDLLRDYDVQLIEIPAESFCHGGTRNFGAQQASGTSEFLVYLTQDATPQDRHWLNNLILPMQEDQRVAATFSRHIPRQGTSVSASRQMVQQSQTGGSKRLVKEFPASEQEYEQKKFFYIYFSNTSSAIRKRVWQEIPFDEVNFAEDALWADKVLRKGYKIVFEPASRVLHTHDYSIKEQFRQNVDHAYAMDQLFAPPFYRSKSYWKDNLLKIPQQVSRDLRFLRSPAYTFENNKIRNTWMILRSPFWHLATNAGAFLGAHLDQIPPYLRKFLSHQEKVKKQ